MAARTIVTCAVAGAIAIGVAAACREPTEILVDIHTDVACGDATSWHGIAVYAGTPGLDVETRAASLTAASCDASGKIGSIAIVPSQSNDATLGVRVVAGISRDPEECQAHGYDGCIVSRRTLSFIAHSTLHLDVALNGACVGQACDALHSCVDGVCADSRLSGAPDTDGGIVGPTVRCGDNGVRCATTGQVCCLEVSDGGTNGSCRLPKDCPPTSVVLNCDDESDCVGPDDDAGRPPQCCLSYEIAPAANQYDPSVVHATQCLPFGTCSPYGHDALCQNRLGCVHGAVQCIAGNAALPGYFWCNLPQR